MTFQMLIQTTRIKLQAQEVENATFEAHELLCHCGGMTKAQLFRDLNTEVAPESLKNYETLLERRLAGEPLAYLLSQWDFYGMTLKINPAVLIPRIDTEILAQRGITLASQLGGQVLDLCAGSGCVGLSVARAVPEVTVVLGEISPEARAVAAENISGQKMKQRVRCVEADALAPPTLSGFNLILSNPPYISQKEMEKLPDMVKSHEPHLALFGGEDGFDFYRSITTHWKTALNPGGYLVFEVGHTQANMVEFLLEEAGFGFIKRYPDTQNIMRVVEGKLPL